jgi:tryptophanyl-tRNA synthetase
MSEKTPAKVTVLTGVQATGLVHIGNYAGAVRPALELSKQPGAETWLFVADYHALTNVQDGKKLREMTLGVAAAWLACGLDPKRSILYKQSDIPEIMELNWILSCFCPKGLMNRAHAYKAKVQENEQNGKEDLDFGVNMGLFNYPILMTADILMFNADKVPVGEDQLQHLEIARDIAQKFNRAYGDLIRMPAAVLMHKTLVPGLDGRKMSKSYDNYISMFEEPGPLKRKVARIKTDSLPPDAPKPVEGSLIFDYYKLFATPDECEAMKTKYAAGISWGAAKEELYQLFERHLSGPRAEFKRLMADPGYVDGLLKDGAKRAREVAVPFLHKLRRAVGVEA